MSPDGSPWRVVHSLPGGRHIADYRRPDGTVYLRIPIFDFRKAETWPARSGGLPRTARSRGSFDSLGEWFRGWVRELTVGDERAFVFMESRGVVPHLVPMLQADNVHLVYLLHNMHLDRPRRWDSRLAGKSYARLLDGIPGMDAMVTLTERQRQDIALRRGDTENLFVVPNPVDMPAAPATEVTRDPRRIAVVARLEPQKRLAHALRAFARVVESVPDAHFDIYGRGPGGHSGAAGPRARHRAFRDDARPRPERQGGVVAGDRPGRDEQVRGVPAGRPGEHESWLSRGELRRQVRAPGTDQRRRGRLPGPPGDTRPWPSGSSSCSSRRSSRSG